MVIDDIRNIFKSDAEILFNSNELVIKETKNKLSTDTLKKVILTNFSSSDGVAYKLDKHIPLTKYFDDTNSKGFNKGVDALLFIVKNGIGYIFFFELKSYTLKKKDVANKFFSSAAFIHQVEFILKNIYDKNISEFNSAAIVFSLNRNNSRLTKFGMRPDQPIFKNENYSNLAKSIQVLEISKNNGQNFKVSIDKILSETRCKKFKNWP